MLQSLFVYLRLVQVGDLKVEGDGHAHIEDDFFDAMVVQLLNLIKERGLLRDGLAEL